MNIRAILLAAIVVGAASPVMAGGKVYVPIGSANQVLVIDAATDKIVGKIGETEATHGLAGTPSGKYLIAGSYTEFEPGETGAPAKPSGVSDDEHNAHHAKRTGPAAITKDGSASFVSLIRTSDRKIVRRITVPGAVHHVETTPDNRYAVLTHPNRDAVSVIDLALFETTKLIPTGNTPNYAIAAKDGNLVYVSNAGDNTVSEVDIEAGIVTRRFQVGKSPEHMVVSDDGKTLYVANADGGTVSAVSLDSGEVARTYRIGGGLHGIDLSDDGNTLFVAARENDRLVAIDLATGRKRSGALSPEPYHLTTIPGTGKLYVSSAEEDKIWVVDQASLQPKKEISVPDRAHQMVVFKQ